MEISMTLKVTPACKVRHSTKAADWTGDHQVNVNNYFLGSEGIYRLITFMVPTREAAEALVAAFVLGGAELEPEMEIAF